MAFRIIDSKKVDMTNDEWSMYEQIVKSYSIGNLNGEDLFIDLFEVDSNGIIVFLRPPSKRQTSFEVFMFCMSLMQQQHLRCVYKTVDDCVMQIKNKMKEIDKKLEEIGK